MYWKLTKIGIVKLFHIEYLSTLFIICSDSGTIHEAMFQIFGEKEALKIHINNVHFIS